jgi:hypothetical protein
MENYLTDCRLCHGNGKIEVSGNDEPYYEDWVTCDYCEEGKVLDSELIEEKLYDVNDLILGMKTRIELYEGLVKKCRLGYLDNLANKFEKRVETCKRGLLRLAQYKLKLQNL